MSEEMKLVVETRRAEVPVEIPVQMSISDLLSGVSGSVAAGFSFFARGMQKAWRKIYKM